MNSEDRNNHKINLKQVFKRKRLLVNKKYLNALKINIHIAINLTTNKG